MSANKAQALLAYLAVHPGQRHPRDKLTALLWGGRGEAQARDSLRHTLLLERWQWVRELVIASTPGSRRRGLSP